MRISTSDILALYQKNGIEDWKEREELDFLIDELDDEWMTWAAKQSEKNPKKNGKKKHD